MDIDEMRKKIIKDKFDDLEPIVLNRGENIALVSDNNYGVYYDRKYNGFGINPYYFMFGFIGLGFSEDVETLREYVNYIIRLGYDKFKLNTPELGDNDNPRRTIDYSKDVVDNINEYIFTKWERENR